MTIELYIEFSARQSKDEIVRRLEKAANFLGDLAQQDLENNSLMGEFLNVATALGMVQLAQFKFDVPMEGRN